MKDGRHMLSGEGGTASSPRFKSKRRSKGPDIFKVLKKEEIGQIKILEVQEGSFHKRKFKCALKRTACLYKKISTRWDFKDRRGELRIRRGHSKIEEASSEIEEASCFSRRVDTRHTQTQLCGNHGQFVEAPIPDIEEAHVFFSLVKHLSYAHSTLRKSRAICRRFSQGGHTEPFFISENAFPTKPLGSLSVPYSLGYLCKPMTPKQKYLISPG
ncbi:hypothetical protein ACFX10_031352 [Malus domestica]